MKRKRKALWYVLPAAVLLAALCSFRLVRQAGEGEGETYEIYDRHYVMITDADDGELWDRVYESALEEGRSRDIYVERFGENLSVEYSRNQLLELAVMASVDGIITTGGEDEETIDLIDEAVDAGIPVVTLQSDSTGSRRQCFVGSNNYNIGQEYGKQILRIMEESDIEDGVNVLVLIDEGSADASQNLILLAIRETLEQELSGEISVTVETKALDNTRDFSPEESIRDIFLDAEELPDILVCLNKVYTQCAYQAAVDYNKVGIVRILGYYDSDAILNAVAKDIIDSVITPDTEQMGRLCVQALDEYEETGYINNYLAVDTRLITAADAEAILADEE